MVIKDMIQSVGLNTNFYQNTLSFSKWRIFRYFFIVVLLQGMVLSLFIVGNTVDEIYRLGRAVFEGRFPTITVDDGVLQSSAPQPYARFIQMPGSTTPSFWVVIDTTGQITELGPEYARGVVLMKNRILLKMSFMKQWLLDNKKISNIIGPISITDTSIDKAKPFLAMFLWPLFAGMLATQKMFLHFFILLVASLLITKIMRNMPLSWKQVFTLSIYTLAPAVVFTLIFEWMEVPLPGIILMELATVMVYLHRVIRNFGE